MGIPERNRRLGRRARGRVDDNKMVCRKMGWGGIYWIDLA
jgi:hypothetical protein